MPSTRCRGTRRGPARARAQGGMLDIHDDNGRPALQAAGLTEEFRGLVLEGREAMRILDRDATVLLDEPDNGTGARPEHPATAKIVGGGSLFALAPGKGIQAHREKGGTLHTYVALTEPQDWFAAIDFTDPAAATDRIAGEFHG